ncbi:MAG: copper resistance protein CopC [Acidobacteria bacterium]|jgi:methionine-rich copper-binding protein CopC|nr:copper resistance protein CopC [Acidobacteriota bacterium]
MTREILATVVLMSVCVASFAAAPVHLEITKTLPMEDTVIVTAPTKVQLWFSQAPTTAVSSITLEDTTGRVTLGKVTAGQTDGKADHSLVAEVTGAMTPGAYTVRWKTSGKDGHMLTGSFGYTFTPKR